MVQDKLLINQGKILLQAILNASPKKLTDAEFKVFSQFQDDGIIQYLVSKVRPSASFFIEFGVENYLESNTRFLLQNNNWSGFVMDGSRSNVEAIRNHYFYWEHDLIALEAFITAENINDLLKQNVPGLKAGLLHIDVDGNDYWIWKAIDCIAPEIVIVEYNSVFGIDRAITIPYTPDFVRTKHHHSNLFAGASLLALCDLAETKGYFFVGSNSAGNNAYFVRKENIGDIRVLRPEEGYVESKFRESRDAKGNLTYLRGKERLEAIRGMKVFNTRTGKPEIL